MCLIIMLHLEVEFLVLMKSACYKSSLDIIVSYHKCILDFLMLANRESYLLADFYVPGLSTRGKQGAARRDCASSQSMVLMARWVCTLAAFACGPSRPQRGPT